LTGVWNTTITNWNTGHHGDHEAVGHGESNETHGEGAH